MTRCKTLLCGLTLASLGGPVVACGAGGRRTAPSSTSPVAASSSSAPSAPSGVAPFTDLIRPLGDVPAAVADALTTAGHACAASETERAVQICDAGRPGRATFAVVYDTEMVYFTSHYRRRETFPCADVVPLLNQLNVAVDGLKLVCVDDRVTFVTSFIVPDNGISPGSVAAHARRFQGQIQVLLREGGLARMLE
ncbi:MAG: hypothetical protein AAF928_12970 [Myxococcota bacterium]